jgi:hypothetical protein
VTRTTRSERELRLLILLSFGMLVLATALAVDADGSSRTRLEDLGLAALAGRRVPQCAESRSLPACARGLWGCPYGTKPKASNGGEMASASACRMTGVAARGAPV